MTEKPSRRELRSRCQLITEPSIPVSEQITPKQEPQSETSSFLDFKVPSSGQVPIQCSQDTLPKEQLLLPLYLPLLQVTQT